MSGEHPLSTAGVRRPRVLFVMPDLAGGGAERSLVELLRQLDRSRIEPRLFLLKRAGVYLDRIPEEVDFSWTCESGCRLRYRLPAILQDALIQGSSADVIVGALETSATYVAWIAATLLRKPLLGWVRTDLDEYLHSGWHRRMAGWIYPRCAAVVVASHGSGRSLQRVARVAEAKLHTIPVPVDPEEVRAMASEPLPPEAQAVLETVRRKPFILGAGRLSVPQKGFDLLIRAHAAVRARGLDHNVVLLGEGEDRLVLQQLARSLHVEDSVFMPGFQRNPFPFFRAAAALAAPSRLEGFGRIFLEAMALGLPVIGSTASGPAEILDGGKYGIQVPLDDAAALSDAMHALLSDAQTHARYSRLSLARASEYRPEPIAQRWDELLCSLAEPRVAR